MKSHLILLMTALLTAAVASPGAEDAAKRAASIIVLDETGVKNLRIETEEVEETTFEETIFALGRVEAIPSKIAAVSSRIPGRIIELKASAGDSVKQGDQVAKVESRQPGDPPPVIPLTAPISGLVAHVDLRLGDPIDADKSLLEITDLSEVFAIARVPEHLAGKLKPGAAAHIRVAALPEEKFDGELLRFGTSADKQSGTLDAVFRLPNPSLTLRPNMRAEFSIVLSKRENVMSVPRAALQGDAVNRALYVKDFDLKNAFIKTPVQVGQINDRRVEIISGLLPGDEVVTRGAYSLAFAGGGSVSLKAALDAAHGHEHNADGSEISAADKAKGHKHEGDEDHDHEHEGESQGRTTQLAMLSYIMNGVLVVLLIIAALRKPTAEEPAKPATKEA